jgi:hypothetical protein
MALTSYLTRQQDGQEWALIDNLDADEARELAKLAITMLRDANAVIGISALALDDMAPRAERFKYRDAAKAMQDPYLDALAKRFNGAPSPTTNEPTNQENHTNE